MLVALSGESSASNILRISKMATLTLFFPILLSAILLPSVSSYRILISVLGVSGSQNLVMYRLAEYLGQHGHDVLILKAEVFPEAKSIPLKFSKELTYELVPPAEIAPLRETLYTMPWETTNASPVPLGLFYRLFNSVQTGCGNLLTENPKIIAELRSKKFDAAVVHFVDFCAFGLMPTLGIKGYVWMSTAFLFEPMGWYAGVPYPSSYVPAPSYAVNPDSMTFYQRGRNLAIATFVQSFVEIILLPAFTTVFRKAYGPAYPSLPEILSNTSLYFANSDPFFDFPRPTQHNIVYMGGFTSDKPDPLNEEWQKILDESQDGVVVFAMGSVVNTAYMPNSIKVKK